MGFNTILANNILYTYRFIYYYYYYYYYIYWISNIAVTTTHLLKYLQLHKETAKGQHKAVFVLFVAVVKLQIENTW